MNRKAQIKFLAYCIGLIEDIKLPTNFKELTKKDWSKILIKAKSTLNLTITLSSS